MTEDLKCSCCGETELEIQTQLREDGFPDWCLDIKDGLCFNCSYWLELLTGNPILINGHSFVVGPADDWPRGFCGQRFIIQLQDGQIIDTSNLWTQGPVPEMWFGKFTRRGRFIPLDGNYTNTVNS